MHELVPTPLNQNKLLKLKCLKSVETSFPIYYSALILECL